MLEKAGDIGDDMVPAISESRLLKSEIRVSISDNLVSISCSRDCFADSIFCLVDIINDDIADSLLRLFSSEVVISDSN